jgi:hypothetical protein
LALPGLAQSYEVAVDWEAFLSAYSKVCLRAVLNQMLNPFKVKQLLRNAVAVTGALSRVVGDRSKLQGLRRGIDHLLRNIHHAAKMAVGTSH